MNLKKLNKIELDQRIKSLASQERTLLHEILLTIKEIDQRRSYLELGFANLFSYLVEGVGYSAGSAQRRIDAARLLSEVPALGEKIKSGEVKLQQISLLQITAREVFKTTHKNVTSAEKEEILESIANQSFEVSQKEIASYFDIPVIEATKKTVQSDESVRVSVTLSKELAAKIQRAQELLSHSLATNDLVTYLEFLTDKVIKQKTSVRSTATVAVKREELAKDSVGFSNRVKKIVLNRHQACQHRDIQSGKMCGSRWFLQVDHKLSKWAAGSNRIENAQVLCAQHNNLKYRKEVGLKLLALTFPL
ncbi:MAG: HNH endonuclease [Bdellovibrio sp.]|nr:HNH endonuclease [Bdellovibrio sp.]